MSSFSYVKLNNILLVFYMTATCWASIITSFIQIPNISAFISIFICSCIFYYHKGSHLKKNTFKLFIFIVLILLLSLFANYNNLVQNYFFFYLIFGFTALNLSNLDYNGNLIIKYSIYTYFIYIIVFMKRIYPQYFGTEDFGLLQMGWAYSFVPGVLWGVALFMYSSFGEKKTLILKLIATFDIFFCSYIILFNTITRGAILAVLIGVFFIFILKLNIAKRNLVVLFILFFVFILWLLFDILLNELGLLLSDYNIGAINKLLFLSDGDDISNGRDLLYEKAYKIISSSPIIGHGVGYYELYNNIYVHQIFLQLMCEFGIIGMIVFLFPIYRTLKSLYFSNASYYTIVMIILMTSTLVNLLFSSAHWLVPNFWLMYFFSYRKIKNIK